jgi:signal peptidase I
MDEQNTNKPTIQGPNSEVAANTTSAQKASFLDDFLRRCRSTKTTRRIRFAIVALLYIAWVIWMNNYWFLLGLPLLFDIYITGYIPFTWWKKSKNTAVRSVMSWVDAIVYALILVYFVFNFFGQNYQIPSSSLEKTLLTGDYLWVNKMVYGPRVPITPIHFPLVHNKLPILNCNSYTSVPENSYRRLKGLRNVESGDIVVFNFPAGDTVATKYEESPEYYDILVKNYGREELKRNKEKFGDIVYRPVDRRTNFVKRCVGLPGERLKIKDDIIYINGKAQKQPENVQYNYLATMQRPLDADQLHELEITESDVQMIAEPTFRERFLELLPKASDTDYLYILPLTKSMIKSLVTDNKMSDYAKVNQFGLYDIKDIFPEGVATNWTLSNYGGDEGLLIPKKGLTVELNAKNWLTYKRVIRNYEHHTNSYFKNGQAYVDGKPAKTYTFEMDYYFMMGDNRDNSQDSRFWGFVPEDHIVGTPMFVLISFDRDRSMFDGGVRWNRVLRSANPDKE